MVRKVVGYVKCPFTLERSPVYRNRNDRLYYSNGPCGPVNVHGQAFQDWIEDQLEEPDQEAEPEPVDPPPVPDNWEQVEADRREAEEPTEEPPKRERPWLIDDEEDG